VDVRQMRQVVAIADRRSFVKAAGDLGISQPTLSRSIARLEDELGLTLFDRSLAGVTPTPIGKVLADRARSIIDDAGRLLREVQLINGGELGQVRIGGGLQLAPVFLPRLSLALTQQFPKLSLRLIIEQRAVLLRDLYSGELDLILVAAGRDLVHRDLYRVELMRQQMVAVASPSHPLAGQTKISVRDFLGYPGVATTTADIFLHRDLLDLEENVSDTSSHIVTNEFHITRSLVVQGGLTAIGQQQIFDEDIRSGAMVILDVPSLSKPTRVLAVMMRSSSHSTLLGKVADLATDIGLSLS
jgi:DNA-binding transcriptional LysR family regulator